MLKELVEVVEKNGFPTGEVLEKTEAKNKNLFHKVVSLFIINNKNQILLQKRSPNKKTHPNKWGLCEGHVIAFESNLTAMLRELKEEVGVIAKPEDIILFCTTVKEREINSNITYSYYMLLEKEEKDFIIQEEELSEVKWVDFKEYKNMVLNNDPNVTFSNNNWNIVMINKLGNIILNKFKENNVVVEKTWK